VQGKASRGKRATVERKILPVSHTGNSGKFTGGERECPGIRGDQLRVVTTSSHRSYLGLLTSLPFDFTVVMEPGQGRDESRGDRRGAWPPCPPLVTRAEALQEARETPFDLALAHSLADVEFLWEICPRQIVVFHRTLAGQVAAAKIRLGRQEYAARVAHYLTRLRVGIVFTSAAVAASWDGLSGRVIAPGIPAAAQGGYTGRQPAVLCMGHDDSEAADALGPNLQRDTLHGIPKSVVQRNLGWTGEWSSPVGSSADQRELAAGFRHHRCLFATYRSEGEDGYDTELLIAMASGMPVVTTPHPTSPVRHGFSGLVGSTAPQLRRHLVRLLHQRELARRLGENARRTVNTSFPHAAFRAAWTEIISARAGAEAASPCIPRRSSQFFRPDLSLIEGVPSPSPHLVAPGSPPRLTVIEGGRLA
jgi:hypothetical protein